MELDKWVRWRGGWLSWVCCHLSMRGLNKILTDFTNQRFGFGRATGFLWILKMKHQCYQLPSLLARSLARLRPTNSVEESNILQINSWVVFLSVWLLLFIFLEKTKWKLLSVIIMSFSIGAWRYSKMNSIMTLIVIFIFFYFFIIRFELWWYDYLGRVYLPCNCW